MSKIGKIFLATAFTDFTGKTKNFATNEHELTQIFHHEVHEVHEEFLDADFARLAQIFLAGFVYSASSVPRFTDLN